MNAVQRRAYHGTMAIRTAFYALACLATAWLSTVLPQTRFLAPAWLLATVAVLWVFCRELVLRRDCAEKDCGAEHVVR